MACPLVCTALCQLRCCPWQEGLVEGRRQVSKTGVASAPAAGLHLSTRRFPTKSAIFCRSSVGTSHVSSPLGAGVNKDAGLAVLLLALCPGRRVCGHKVNP